MADKKVKYINLNNQILKLGGDGILSFTDITSLIAEPTVDLPDGAIAWVSADDEQKYYQYRATNTLDAKTGYWRELQFGTDSQVIEMPEPNDDYANKIVQYVGETVKDMGNVTQYVKGYFYQCVKADEESYVAVTVSSTTVGTYYTKDDEGNYTEVILDGKGNGYIENTQYYRKTPATYRWESIDTQSTDDVVKKENGKGLSTNDLTDELKENYDNASDKAHEHTNKGTLDKLSMSTDGNLTVEKETDVSLELLYGKSLTKNQYEQMVTDGTIQDDMVYVVDEEDADAGWIINDSSTTATDKTWSAKKISSSTIPYVLMDVTKDIDLNEYVETGYYTPNKSFSTGWFTHSILNAPTNGWLPAGGFALEVKTFDNTSSSKWCTQVLYSYVGTDNNSAPMYTRTFFYDGSKVIFSPWKRIADIDDSKVSSEETWSSKKINDTTVLKNTKILYKNAPTSSGMTTFTLDISSLGLTNGIYHFKCYIVGNGNVAHCAEGSIGQYDGSYYISIDYKSSHISSIVINGTTITVTTSAAYYNLSFSIQSIYDWAEA